MTSKIIKFIKAYCEACYELWADLLNGLCILLFEPFVCLWKYLKNNWCSSRSFFYKCLASLYYMTLLPLIAVMESVDNCDIEKRYGATSLLIYALVYSLIIWLSIGYALYNL